MIDTTPLTLVKDMTNRVYQGDKYLSETHENVSRQVESLNENFGTAIEKMENLEKKRAELNSDLSDLSYELGRKNIENEYESKMRGVNSSELPKIQEELKDVLVTYEREYKEKERTEAEEAALKKLNRERTEILRHGTEEEKNKVFEEIKEDMTKITRKYIKTSIETKGLEETKKTYTFFFVEAYTKKAEECAKEAVVAEQEVVAAKESLESAKNDLQKVEKEVEKIKAKSQSIGVKDAQKNKTDAEANLKKLKADNKSGESLTNAEKRLKEATKKLKEEEEKIVPKENKIALKNAKEKVEKAEQKLYNATESVRYKKEEQQDNLAIAAFNTELFKEAQLKLEQEKGLTATPAKENKSFVSQHQSKNKGNSKAEQIKENKTPNQSNGIGL